MSLRTDAVALDETFVALGNVCKTSVDAATGKRYIRGVASGVLEDRDGERVSTNAIRKMAAAGPAGVKITAGHDQDWLTEFGDVIKISHDRGTDELLVDCELPPEGEDPIADKAFKRACREQLGFSIGGKLKSAFYELVQSGGVAKRRKVLDEILLRHVALTKKPAYAPSFASAVAKTFTGDAPAPDADDVWKSVELFVDEPVAKAAPAPDDQDGDEPAAPAQGQQEQPPAGTADEQPAAPTDAQADQADAAQLPVARHLACPNCGHEFAAPLSADEPANRPDDETDGGDDAAKTSVNAPDTTRKDMAHTTSPDPLELVKALADALGVEKTAETTEAEVAKTAEAPEAPAAIDGEVAKTLAAGIGALESATAEAFGEVAKALTGVIERLDAMPRGRRSVARVLPPNGEVVKTEADDDTDDVAKTVADAPNALAALKAINAARGVA